MKLAVCVCVLSIFIFSSSLLGDSVPINGSFETGTLAGWSTVGDVAILTAASLGVAPTDGTYQAVVSNAPSLNSAPGPGKNLIPPGFTFCGCPVNPFAPPPLPDVSFNDFQSFYIALTGVSAAAGGLFHFAVPGRPR